ncbi:MAG TPA: (5-formylfuran-3-yl)methyl phosphate synthase [Methanosarcinales archaeon]|nr:MAG: (5-formylfuran-3-yl)methyl phosphate synthase [Methanosarcinales archaeon]HDN65311.1 (5-formylfuran-3-yl)methyl phosphate synthase [Methanosarcinales archaeon]
MKLLVSPINPTEAKAALYGGADIVDVKNPKEGSLGANFPWVIRAVIEAIESKKPVSATIGDFNFKPGTASLAALGAATSGADYIKIGLYDIQTTDQAEELLSNVVQSIKGYDPNKFAVAAAYADYRRINSISPLLLPEVGAKVGADVVMIDTGIKDGKSLFEFMGEEELTRFVDDARDLGLTTALAGTIKFEDLDVLRRINPDILGIRGVVCGGDRNDEIKQELVEEFKSKM